MDLPRRQQLLRHLAWCCVLLVLAVTSLSAYIRLSRAGLGCAGWPQCYGQSLRQLQQGGQAASDDEPGVQMARGAHRVVAVAALVSVVAMLVLAFGKAPLLRREGLLALALLALTLAVALLGRYSGAARVPAVTLGNLLGGFGMLALAARLTVGRSPHPIDTEAPVRNAALAAAALLLMQAALGGLSSASYAGLACSDLAGCRQAAAGIGWSALDPWREPLIAAGGGAAESGALAQLLHRAGASLAAAATVLAAWRGWRAGQRSGAALVALLLAVELGIGWAMVRQSLPLPLATAHNAAAALLLIAVVRLAGARRSL
jgi:cytochrome c oxidase assembly protein subunit 15